MDDKTKFIFVANNYRLGVSGWTYLPEEDLVANLGMHDCLAAARWTEKYIERFGGNKQRVTVMGQSAGAGIIGLLTVLEGGKGKLPFQQVGISHVLSQVVIFPSQGQRVDQLLCPWKAVILSPGILPRQNPVERQKTLFQMILDEANCTSTACLRSVSESTIASLNKKFIIDTPSDAGGGVFGPAPGFGPVPDGSFIPDMLVALFQRGDFYQEVQSLVVGNVANEVRLRPAPVSKHNDDNE